MINKGTEAYRRVRATSAWESERVDKKGLGLGAESDRKSERQRQRDKRERETE